MRATFFVLLKHYKYRISFETVCLSVCSSIMCLRNEDLTCVMAARSRRNKFVAHFINHPDEQWVPCKFGVVYIYIRNIVYSRKTDAYKTERKISMKIMECRVRVLRNVGWTLWICLSTTEVLPSLLSLLIRNGARSSFSLCVHDEGIYVAD